MKMRIQKDTPISEDEDSSILKYMNDPSPGYINDLSPRYMKDFSTFSDVYMAYTDVHSLTSLLPPYNSTGDNLLEPIVSSELESQMCSSKHYPNYACVPEFHPPPESAQTDQQMVEPNYNRDRLSNYDIYWLNVDPNDETNTKDASTIQDSEMVEMSEKNLHIGSNTDTMSSQDNVVPPANCEGLGQDVPKKKRTKVKPTGEGEAFKGCRCKKTMCLKLYCCCFKAGFHCTELCLCQGSCCNKQDYVDKVMASRIKIQSRNPSAFYPVMSSNLINTPASTRHNKRCNCKKSGCSQRYCECYKAGVGCSKNCGCIGCNNSSDRRNNGQTLIGEAKVDDLRLNETHVMWEAPIVVESQHNGYWLDSSFHATHPLAYRSLPPSTLSFPLETSLMSYGTNMKPSVWYGANMNPSACYGANMNPSTSYTMSSFGLCASHQVENGNIVQSYQNL